MKDTKIHQLTQDKFDEAVDLVLSAELDTREEIEHHLQDLKAHYVALNEGDDIVGVIGWYQDNVNYADQAMGEMFPGEEAYWVGFFAVDPKYRGQGIGYSLINRLQEILINMNVDELWVSSVPESAGYYQRQGFIEVVRGMIGGNQKIFMVKRW